MNSSTNTFLGLIAQVNQYLGAFIEGFATLCCRLASKVISEKDARFGAFIDSFIGTSLVVAGKGKSEQERDATGTNVTIQLSLYLQRSTTRAATSTRCWRPP